MIVTEKVKAVLQDYLQARGGDVNKHKCRVLEWNSSPINLQNIVDKLEFSIRRYWNSFIYLGIPIFLGRPTTLGWEEVIEKIKKRMNHWGSQWLNPMGQLILIKSDLASLAIFQKKSFYPRLGFPLK